MKDGKKYIYVTRVPDTSDFIAVAKDYAQIVAANNGQKADDSFGKIHRSVMIWFSKHFFFHKGNAYQFSFEDRMYLNIGKSVTITNEKLSSMIADFLNVLSYSYQCSSDVDEKSFRESFDNLDFVKAIRQYKIMKPSIVRDNKSILNFTSDEIKPPPNHQLHFKNGFWDIFSKKFAVRRAQSTSYPHLMVLNTLPYNYVKPSTECIEKWKNFLLKIIPDSESLLWVLSYVSDALIGDISTQDCLVLIGGGSNGKSTFLKMIQELFNGYYRSFPSFLLEKNATGHRLNSAVRSLPSDTKMIFIEELTAGKQSGNSIKLLTEPKFHIPAHYNDEPFDYEVHFKIMATSNGIVRYSDADGGLFRRMRFAFLPNKFVDNPELVDNKTVFLRADIGSNGVILKTDEDKSAMLNLLIAARSKIDNRSTKLPSLIETMAEQLCWQKFAEKYFNVNESSYVSEDRMYHLVTEHFTINRYSAIDVRKNLLELKLPFAVKYNSRHGMFMNIALKEEFAEKFPEENQIKELPDILRNFVEANNNQEEYPVEIESEDVSVDGILDDLPITNTSQSDENQLSDSEETPESMLEAMAQSYNAVNVEEESDYDADDDKENDDMDEDL